MKIRRIHLIPSGRGLRDYIPTRPITNDYRACFGTEEKCRDFLFQQRWPNGFVCPKGLHPSSFTWLSHTKLRCHRCRKISSLTAGTILHGTRKPLRLWFQAAFLVVQTGASARRLAEDCRLTYKIAWAWAHKLRRVMRNPHTTLEAPFPPFTPRRFETGRPFLANLARRWFAGHGHFRWEAHRPGGLGECCERLDTNDWSTPDPEKEPDRYADARNGIHVTHVKERMFAAYSGSLSDKHLQAYLDEAEYRFNQRVLVTSWAAIRLVSRFMSTEPLPYRELVGPRPKRDPLWFRGAPLNSIPVFAPGVSL